MSDPRRDRMALTNKQRAFVEHYLATGEHQWNATEAADKAGYKGNRVTLATVGSANLRKPQICKLIRVRLGEMGVTPEAMIRRLLMRSSVDISPYVGGKGGKGLDVAALKKAGLGFLIKGVRETKDATTILLRDPDVAEDRLLRVLGFYVERHEHTGRGGGPIERKDVTELGELTDEELDRLGAIARRIQGD